MSSKPQIETAAIRMLDTGLPHQQRYSGFMPGENGENLRCELTPGVHVLPASKVKQLCRDFPDLFVAHEGEKSPDPPVPESPESTTVTAAAPAFSTESNTLPTSTGPANAGKKDQKGKDKKHG